MGIMQSFKKLLGNDKPAQITTSSISPTLTPEPEPEPIVIPELSPQELMAAQANGRTFVVLDCRQGWERKQARIPESIHIPMNDIPARLHDLDPALEIVVVCAHGNRSYGVTGYLIEQGYHAHNLSGGMASWHAAGGTAGA